MRACFERARLPRRCYLLRGAVSFPVCDARFDARQALARSQGHCCPAAAPLNRQKCNSIAVSALVYASSAARGRMSTQASTDGAKVTRDSGSQQKPEQDILVQYVVLRRDLFTEMKWPLGSVVAQACHASTAALWSSREEATTQQYCAPGALDNMHKVVLEVKGETQLRNLAAKLTEAGVAHKLWIEQPEDFATCLASAPAPKSSVQPHFKKLKLCNF